jgi:hypothetical protein
MTRSINRIAGLLAGAAIAATVAMPVLAAGSRAQAIGDPLAAQASRDTNIARCANDWLKAKADPTVTNLQAAGFCEIDRRLATIDRLHGLVNEAGAVTDAHKTALTAILDASATGLTALRAQIGSDTTVAALRTDIRKIYTDYRIYVLVERQVNLVRGDDRVGAAADRLTGATTNLADAIARAAANGKDVTAAQGHLDAMKADIAKAGDEVAGDADAVLAQTPAAWNAGTSKPVLDAARASIVAARGDLKSALTEARATIAALR